jgi:hypothetical protein
MRKNVWYVYCLLLLYLLLLLLKAAELRVQEAAELRHPQG